jgi:dTDP-4-dehydrorhamnose 3,5-epimerase
MPEGLIKGVIVKDIVSHEDTRGFFREILRQGEDFKAAHVGQLSHSLVRAGVLKAWHYHLRQSQWNYILSGEAHVVLYDKRADSQTYGVSTKLVLGENHPARAYFFPSGVLHGYKCLKGPMHIIYMTSGLYDHSEEGRLPANDPSVPYDWNAV